MNSRRFIALTETQMIMASIPGQGRAPQQQQPAHVRYGSILLQKSVASFFGR
jgi:hypothetical protein